MKLQTGCDVETPYGAGTVSSSLADRFQILLNRRPIKLRFTLAQLVHHSTCPCLAAQSSHTREPLDATAANAVESSPDGSRIHLPQASSAEGLKPLRERYMIEALRYGLVPGQRCSEITVGVERLTNWVELVLPESKEPKIAQVIGAFGTGKSHMMNLVRECAHAKNFVTAHVEVDGHHISFANPAKLFYQLCTHLQDPNGEKISPMVLIRKCLKEKSYPVSVREGHDSSCHRILSLAALLSSKGKLDEFETLLDDYFTCAQNLTGAQLKSRIRDTVGFTLGTEKFPATVRATMGVRNIDFVAALGFLASACEKSGFSGLVLTFDEFEVEHTGTKASFAKTISLLHELGHFVQCAHQKKSKMYVPPWTPAPLGIFFASTGEAGHRGDAAIDDLIDEVGGWEFRLEPFSVEQYVQLGRKILAYYSKAYSVPAEMTDRELHQRAEKLLEAGDSGTTRQFIKGVVANLDTRYGPGLHR